MWSPINSFLFLQPSSGWPCHPLTYRHPVSQNLSRVVIRRLFLLIHLSTVLSWSILQIFFQIFFFKYWLKFSQISPQLEYYVYVFLILLIMRLNLEPGFLGNGHTVCDPVSLSAQYNRIVSVTHNFFNPRGALLSTVLITVYMKAMAPKTGGFCIDLM